MLIDELHIRVVDADTGQLLRELILDRPGTTSRPAGHQADEPAPPEPLAPAPLNRTAARSRRQGWPQATRRARP